MSDIVYCKDCAYAEPNNLDAYHAVKFGVFCTRYKQNTIGIHGCDNGKPKPKTNAERIRNMEDDELAKLIGDSIDCSICKKEVFETTTCPGLLTADGKDCYECWLEWLKQEADT